MKLGAALLLQVATVLLGLVVLVFLLGEPHLEGRNAQATLVQIYFQDPFLAYVYVGSIPFFLALHRAFRLGGQFRRGESRGTDTVQGLRAIRRCALLLLGFVAGGMVLILRFGDREDRPAGVFLGLLSAAAALAMAAVASRLARRVKRALERSSSIEG